MASSYTSLLGLVLPVTGELSGNWGDVWNDSGTSLIDAAISGTTSLTTDADVTLTTTDGVANEARQAIILWNPASGTVTRNITAPARSKIYTVINASGGTQSIVIRGAGPTTGVTIIKGEAAQVAWNGSDFVKISSSAGDVSVRNLTVTGNTILGDASADTVTINGTVTSNLLFTDNTYDIGASGATRPRNLFLAGNATVGGNIVLTGSLDLTNLEVTNIKAKDGTAGMQIADSTGVVSFTANPVMSGGTANGVAYLNGSKVLTTGSALTFDGSTFQSDTSGFRIGKSPADSPSANIYASVIADVNQTSELWIGANTASVVGGSFLSGLGFYNTDNTTPGANLSGIKAYIKDSTGSMYLNFYAGNTYYAANTPQYTIDPAYHAWFSGTTEGMRLTSTGLGIGTSSPAYRLDVVESADSEVSLRVSNQNTGANSIASLYLHGQGNNFFIRNYGDGTSNANKTDFISAAGSSYFTFSPANAERMRIDSSGNLGLGVTPSAWATLKAVQLPGGAIAGYAGGTGNNQFSLLNNAYYDGTNYDYIVTDTAQMYRTTGGTHQWHNAPSGTAGTAITFSERMRLSAAGGLSIGTTTDPGAGGLITTGNVTLGDASTDTVTVNGYMGVGVAPNSAIALYARGTALTGTTQTGVYSYPTATSAATVALRSFSAQPGTADAVFTVADVAGFYAFNPVKGAASTITNAHGLYIVDQTQGTNNYGITSLVSSGSNKYNIYASGTAQNYFAGNVGIGTTTPANQLTVSSAASVIIQALGTNAANPSLFRAQNSDGVTFDFRMNGSSAATNPSTAQITTSGTQSIAFIQSGVESMRIIGSSNNVGIGTATPSSRLDVADATSAILTLTRTDSTAGNGVIRSIGNTGVTNASINLGGGVNNNMVFNTNGSERMRILSTGEIIRGGSAGVTSSGGSVTGIETLGGTTAASSIGQYAFATTNAAPFLEMGFSRNATVGSQTVVNNGDVLGAIRFSGSDGTNFVRGAQIAGFVDGTPGTNDMPGGLYFSTTADGASTPSIRMTLNAAGNVGIGTSSPRSLLNPSGSGSTGAVLTLENSNTALTTGNVIGEIDFYANDPSANGTGAKAKIVSVIENSAGNLVSLTFATSDSTSATGVERMRIDSSGNLGLGVTPSAWGASNKAIQLSGGAVWAFSTTQISLGQNTYDSGSGTFVYASTDAASRYRQLAGAHAWFSAPSGTAGTAITFTQAMTLDADGDLGIGTTSPATKLDVAGAGTFKVDGSGSTTPLILRNNNTASTQVVKLAFDSNGAIKASINAAVYNNDYMAFNVGSDTERVRIDNVGNVQMQTGSAVVWAPAPASISTTATLTNANIQGQIINTTGTSYTVTMPLGSTMETLVPWATTNLGYDFTVINTASGTITMAVNTGVTSLGALTIATGTSANFRIRRTAANTFILYRMS